MKRFFPLLIVVLFFTACASTENGQALLGAPDSPVIFSLDGERVTAADFATRLERDIGANIANLIAQGSSPAEIEQMAARDNIRGQIFDQMIQDALLTRYARQHGIGADPTAVDSAILTTMAPAQDSPFVITAANRVRAARSQQAIEVIVRTIRTNMAHVRHILVADEATATQVLAELSAGGDFATLARTRSLDPIAAAKGGDLGWLPQGSAFGPEFDKVVFEAPLNTPTQVSGANGVHVVVVLERQDDRAFENIEQLRNSPNAQQFYQQSFVPWYAKLRAQAEQSRELQVAPNFDPSTVPLPFPPGT